MGFWLSFTYILFIYFLACKEEEEEEKKNVRQFTRAHILHEERGNEIGRIVVSLHTYIHTYMIFFCVLFLLNRLVGFRVTPVA